MLQIRKYVNNNLLFMTKSDKNWHLNAKWCRNSERNHFAPAVSGASTLRPVPRAGLLVLLAGFPGFPDRLVCRL